MILLISYDLKRPGQTYSRLYEAIKSYGNWWHYLESVWLIDTERTPREVFEHLAPNIDKNDRMLVVEIKEGSWGWLPSEAWTWMRQRGA